MVSFDPSSSPVFFGEWVKRRRKALDLTQEELAFRAGCSKFTLRKIESGERKPSKQLAELLAIALEIPDEEQQKFIKVARGDLNLERLSSPVLESAYSSISDFLTQSNQSRIPIQLKPVLGREPELAAMEKIFNNPICRLLTLTGMGGIGKTSLAVEFAKRHQNMFSAGIYYVPLASIKSTDAIIPAVAEVIGFVFSGPSDPIEQLINYFSSHLQDPLLLVLDNLEHLLAGSAYQEKTNITDFISEMLQRLPNLKILATSREFLNLRGEWTYELHGLPLPPLDFEGSLDDFSAAVLFIHNAKRIKIDFDVADKERLALIKICHLLEGIPLAIELAAAWVGMLTCQEIAQEIENNIDFLTTTMRDIPDRHRSIRASFDHSWNLLSEMEKDVLTKLSVFHGPFDRKAAEQITGATLPLLASLVSKSLVRRTPDHCYDLHEAIRQYGMSHLEKDPIKSFELYNIHSEYYLHLISSCEKSLKSAAQQEVVRELLNSLDNIRAAWKWAVKQTKFEIVGCSLRSFGWFFEVTGLLHEGINQLDPLIQILKSEPETISRNRILGLALAHQGLLFFRKGQFTLAQERYEESISKLRQIDDHSLLADALTYMGIIMHLNGQYETSRQNIKEGLKYAQESDDQWLAAYGIYNLGHIDSITGNYQSGYEQMLVGIDLWRTIGDPHAISLGLNFLVPTLVQLELFDEAKAKMSESIALCEKTKNRWGMGTAYRFLGLATMAAGEFTEAQAHFCKSLEIFGEYYEGWDIAQSMVYLGNAHRLGGKLIEAKENYINAFRISLDSYTIPIAMEAILGLADIELLEGKPVQAFELSYLVKIHHSITKDIKDRAIETNHKAQNELSKPQIKELVKLAESRTMEDIANRFNIESIKTYSPESWGNYKIN